MARQPCICQLIPSAPRDLSSPLMNLSSVRPARRKRTRPPTLTLAEPDTATVVTPDTVRQASYPTHSQADRGLNQPNTPAFAVLTGICVRTCHVAPLAGKQNLLDVFSFGGYLHQTYHHFSLSEWLPTCLSVTGFQPHNLFLKPVFVLCVYFFIDLSKKKKPAVKGPVGRESVAWKSYLMRSRPPDPPGRRAYFRQTTRIQK